MRANDKQRSQKTERRNFLKGVAGIGGATALAGCAGGDGYRDEDGGDGGDGGGDGGGGDTSTLVYADLDTPRTTDPHAIDPSNTSAKFAMIENAYETLVYFPPDSATELIPMLASEVPTGDAISDDLQEVEFTLREGVTFHTGGEMTAEDVKYSWDRAIELNLSPDAETFGNLVDETEAVDDYTFRVSLTSPVAPVFLNAQVTRPVAAIVSREAVEENGGVQAGQPNEWMAQNSAGTGPFMAGNLEAGNEFVWEPHEDYWDETGVDRVRQVARSEFSSRRAMLEQGDAHVVHGNADFYDEIEGAQNVALSFYPSFDPVHITFNYEIPYDRDDVQSLTDGDDTVPSDFFQDPDVRRAFAYAFDYETYAEQVWAGYFERMPVYHFPGMLGYDDGAPIYEHDPEKAEEHFRAAGWWEEGFRITCQNEILPQFSNGNLMLKDNIEALGSQFEVNAVEEPEAQSVERHLQDPPGWPMEFHGFLPQGPDPDAYYRATMHPDGNVSSLTKTHEHISEDIVSLIDEARQAESQDERSSIYQELQQLCFEEVPIIPVGVEERMTISQECVDEVWNPAWSADHLKHYSVDNC